jgi:predicted cupin superfamily sugar epimerase
MPQTPSKWIDRRHALQTAASAAMAVSLPAVTQAQTGTKTMNDLTAEEIARLLNLEPNATCGFVRVTYIAKQEIAPGGLPQPFAGGSPLGSALYFLVTPEAPVRLHRIRNDQLYHYYLGGPLEVLMLHANGETEHVLVGPDIVAGQQVQLFIPGNTFHTARLVGTGRWFLGASTEWPGVLPPDVEIGNLEELAQSYPRVAPEMRAIAASVKVMPTPGAPLR